MTQIKLIKKEYQNFEKNKVENDKIKEIIKSFPEINTKLELLKKKQETVNVESKALMNDGQKDNVSKVTEGKKTTGNVQT